MTGEPRPSVRRPPAAERGSAYLFALLALLVLTVVGLSLVVITQTESQIGGAEKTSNRTLYAAASALRMQLIAKKAGARLWQVELDRQRVTEDELVETVQLAWSDRTS